MTDLPNSKYILIVRSTNLNNYDTTKMEFGSFDDEDDENSGDGFVETSIIFLTQGEFFTERVYNLTECSNHTWPYNPNFLLENDLSNVILVEERMV